MMSGVNMIPTGHNKHQSLLSPGGGGMQLNRENSINNNERGQLNIGGVNNSSEGMMYNMMRHNDSMNLSFDSRRPHYPT